MPVPWKTIQWRGDNLTSYPIFEFRVTGSGRGYFWPMHPHRIGVYFRENVLVCLPIWENAQARTAATTQDAACEFSPNWDNVLGAAGAAGIYWNANHRGFVAATDAARQWTKENQLISKPYTLQSFRDALLADAAKCAAIMLAICRGRNSDAWNAIIESDQELIDAILDAVGSRDEPVLYLNHAFVDHTLQNELFVFSVDGCVVEKDDAAIAARIPRPPDDWIVSVT